MRINIYTMFYILFFLCGVIAILFLIFFNKEKDTTDYDRLIESLNKKKKKNERLLKAGDEEIARLDEEINSIKKKLKFKDKRP